MPRTTNKPTRMTAKKALTAAPSKSITLQQATGQRHRLQPTVGGIEGLDLTLKASVDRLRTSLVFGGPQAMAEQGHCLSS